jgi:LacI family transcriptional regulator
VGRERTKPAARRGGHTRRAATIQDVAKLAHVDASTASRVLRDDPRQKVREATRERILDAARVLDYRPNAAAQSLRTRRTDTFALVIPTIDNPGFVDVVRGIQMEAAEREKLVVVVEAEAIGADEHALSRREELFARLVLDGRVDGMIVAFATPEDRLIARLAERSLPLVLVNRRLANIPNWVAVDDVKGAEVAVEHLVSLGHERIGFLGFGQLADTAQRREQGFRGAMAAAKLDVHPAWVASTDPSKDGGRRAVAEILDASGGDPPTALFSASLVGAIGALAELHERGVTVPESVSLVAFNDHEIANDTSPPLTTVRLPNVQMGRQAMRLAIDVADGGDNSEIMIDGPIEVVQRASTAPPRRSPN